MSKTIDCWIYRSHRHQEMYLYVAQEDGFEELPEALMRHFGAPALVMQLPLNPAQRLAREDVNQVMANLQTQGYHLQLPPDIRPRLREGSDGF